MNNGIENGLHERNSGTMSSRKSVSLGASASAASRAQDLRGQKMLSAGVPQVLVEGPARLLHVDFEGARAVSLYSVDSRNEGPNACRSGAVAAKRTPLRARVRNALDLNVAPGQTVCLVAEGGSVEVAWHAEPAPFTGTNGAQTIYASKRQ